MKPTLEQCMKLLDRLTYPENYEGESCSLRWFSGDGPFEDWANKIAEEYKEIIEREPR